MKSIFIGIALLVAFIMIVSYLNFTSVRSWIGDISMPYRHGMDRIKNIMVPMRDGVKLATDVYRPLSRGDSFPVILIRTTYGGTGFEQIKDFVDHGYAVVVQDVRGRYRSQGDTYSPHRHSRSDGYDTLDWIVEQKWSSGKVGTFGCSYLGETQIMLAATKHPNHIAMIASGAGGAIGKAKESYNYFGFFENGVLNLASALGWFTAEGSKYHNITPRPADYKEKMRTVMSDLPVAQLAKNVVPFETGFDDFISHDLDDTWWEEEGYIDSRDTFSVATLHINDWYDQSLHDTFRLAELMSENAQHPRAKSQHVLIDPGIHCGAGKLREGRTNIGEMEIEYTEIDYKKIYRDWFDYWLKNSEGAPPPRYQYFLIHANQWQTAEQWPPAGVEVRRLYLQRGYRLSEQVPDNGSVSLEDQNYDQFTYNPLDPVPTVGGSICCTYRAEDKAGAIDQSWLKTRDDILVYSSDPVTSDIDIIGNMKATLSVATSTPDTDFTVKITDHYPDGRSYNIQDGVIRLRYRDGINNPKLAEEGEIYKIELELRPTAYRIKKGHRVEVHISSSNFPRLARNLNTGKHEYLNKEILTANNKIFRDYINMSYIELPISLETKSYE